jgi:hypothetical protein
MPSIENVKRWTEQMGIDYYTQFIRAWIPFNAWYNMSYPDLDSDRAKINQMKRTTNSFSDGIISLIRNVNAEATLFKSYISDLHKSLMDFPIRNGENIISFESIIIERNTKTNVNYEYRGVRYFLERTDSGRNCSMNIAVTRTGQTLFHLTQTKYEFNEIEINRAYEGLSEERRRILRVQYQELNPYKPINLLITNNGERFIQVGSYKFINDELMIAKGLIEILYLLRCSLFHGELVPNDQAMNVYKYGFEILRMLVEKIR